MVRPALLAGLFFGDCVNWNINRKNIARKLMLDTGRPPAKVALDLPGGQMISVKEALAADTINKRTFNIWAEERYPVVEKIRECTPQFDFVTHPYLHCGQLETLYLPTVLDGHSLDYAFLDFCSTLNATRLLWMRDQLAPALAKGSTFAITVMKTARSSLFMTRFMEEVMRDCHTAYLTALNSLLAVDGELMANIVAAIELAMSSCMLRLDRSYTYRSCGKSGSAMVALRFSVVKKGDKEHLPSRLENRMTRLLASRPSYRPTLMRFEDATARV
jgi:hypothetical protein